MRAQLELGISNSRLSLSSQFLVCPPWGAHDGAIPWVLGVLPSTGGGTWGGSLERQVKTELGSPDGSISPRLFSRAGGDLTMQNRRLREIPTSLRISGCKWRNQKQPFSVSEPGIFLSILFRNISVHPELWQSRGLSASIPLSFSYLQIDISKS